MKFDIYRKFRLDVVREAGTWVAYRLEPGKRIVLKDFAIPDFLDEGELAIYLDDIYREMGEPGERVTPLASAENSTLSPVRQLPRLAPKNTVNKNRIADDGG